MNRMLAVANWTFLESRSRGEVVALLAVAVLCVLMMGVLSFSTPSEKSDGAQPDQPVPAKAAEQPAGTDASFKGRLGDIVPKMLTHPDRDIVNALTFSTFFISFIAVLLSSNILKDDLDSGVLASILTKPITRGQYLMGKFLGLNMVVLLCWGVMAVLLMILGLVANRMSIDLVLALVGQTLNLMLLTALIFRFSLWMPRVVASVVGLAWYLAGWVSPELYGAAVNAGSKFWKYLYHAGHVLIPPVGRLTYFGKQQVIDANTPLIAAPEIHVVLLTALWALGWVVLMLWLTGRRFSRTEI